MTKHTTSAERPDLSRYKRRIDALVVALGLVSVTALIGIVFELSLLIYALVAPMLCLFLLLPCVSNTGRHTGASLWVAVYSGGMLALMIAVLVGEQSSATLAHLPLGSALFLFVLWPYTVVGGGLLYAGVYGRWLGNMEPAWTEDER